MEQFNAFLVLLDSNLSGSWWFPALLIGTGIFFTIYLGFPQFKYFNSALKIVSGKTKNSESDGETTGFQALTTAMSGAVGTGNIGGVALAIWTGGPAAIFWMWITAIFGMTTKYVEVTLGHKYRTTLNDGSISGGPMYYIEQGLNMKWVAILFAFLMMITAIGSGNMPQINNIALVMNTEFAVPKLFTGLFLGALLWIIIIGGIKRIGSVTSKLVPSMAVIYLVSALIIIFSNYNQIPSAISSIFIGAFSPEGVTGGFLGVLILGFRRAVFSNEAGIGSAPIAHSAVKTDDPTTEGLVSLLEPFVDTVIICTLTALVIITYGVYITGQEIEGARMTSQAFGTVLPTFPYLLALVATLFAFSTMISWSYYGVKAVTFIFGESKNIETLYKVIFCLFAIVGSSLDLVKVIDLSDAALFLMAIPNLIGVYILAGIGKKESLNYFSKLKKIETV